MEARSTILTLFEEAFERNAWHGPNLWQSLKGVSAQQAAWRPAHDRHNIWEETLHAAYWKYRVRRRLAGDTDSAFDLAGSNWFVKDSGRTWARELQILAVQHRQLRQAVAGFPEARIDRPVGGSQVTAAHLIRGIAAHDLYHAGQIQMLKRMLRSR